MESQGKGLLWPGTKYLNHLSFIAHQHHLFNVEAACLFVIYYSLILNCSSSTELFNHLSFTVSYERVAPYLPKKLTSSIEPFKFYLFCQHNSEVSHFCSLFRSSCNSGSYLLHVESHEVLFESLRFHLRKHFFTFTTQNVLLDWTSVISWSVSAANMS